MARERVAKRSRLLITGGLSLFITLSAEASSRLSEPASDSDGWTVQFNLEKAPPNCVLSFSGKSGPSTVAFMLVYTGDGEHYAVASDAWPKALIAQAGQLRFDVTVTGDNRSHSMEGTLFNMNGFPALHLYGPPPNKAGALMAEAGAQGFSVRFTFTAARPLWARHLLAPIDIEFVGVDDVNAELAACVLMLQSN